jgi:hypothetical protein
MPNTIAYLVLFSWPVVVYVLFRRLPPAAAVAWTFVTSYLLLPTYTGIDLPLVPTLNKNGLPAVVAVLMLVLGVGVGVGRGPRRAGWQGGGAVSSAAAGDTLPARAGGRGSVAINTLLWLALLSPALTVLLNTERLVYGPTVIPGLRVYDIFSLGSGLLFSLIPFLLARRYIASPESHAVLLKALALAMLAYSLLILYEVRMSPQINRMVYGFFPHSFAQHIRGDGYRPLVFLNHGLWLAIAVAMTLLAAAALWRQRRSEARPALAWLLAALYLLAVLVLCRSFGALVIGVLLLLPVLLLGVRGQLLLAAVVAGTVLFFPALRSAGLIPVDRIYEITYSINPDRAASYEIRVKNEDALLAKANQKPLAGWGSWGRNRVFDEETGKDISVTDGIWALIIGIYGWVGYIAQFGLLTLPTVLLAYRRRELGLSYATAGLALVMAANLIDMIPNATLTPITWLVAGALAGRYAYQRAPDEDALAERTPRRSWGPVAAAPQWTASAPAPGMAPEAVPAAAPAAAPEAVSEIVPGAVSGAAARDGRRGPGARRAGRQPRWAASRGLPGQGSPR